MSLKNSKIIVVKIGSSLIVDNDKKIRKKWLMSFAKDIKNLKSKNRQVVIVSSGAIALGCKKMNYSKSSLKLDKSQAIASIGQIELMNLFSETFSKYKLNISQILLTLEDTEERRRSINAKRTFENLFQLNYIPIVNENDTIATSEIKFGDNDRLASRVAQITNADTLILLSDVDGLYTKNPKNFRDAKLIRNISIEPPLKGKDLKLSIDLDLQKRLFSDFKGRKGALVAIEPRTGLIRALISSPTYDPNLLNSINDYEEVKSLFADKDSPLFNRALSGQYPPASTLKPFVGMAALEAKTISWEKRIDTVIRKLRRESKMDLSFMNDICGYRVIVPSKSIQSNFLEVTKRIFSEKNP